MRDLPRRNVVPLKQFTLLEDFFKKGPTKMAAFEKIFAKSLKNAEISESLFFGLLPRRSFYQDELFKIKSFGVRALNRNKTKKPFSSEMRTILASHL